MHALMSLTYFLHADADRCMKAKHMVERCLAQGMNKAQMFRAIREEGLHPAVAFAGETHYCSILH